MNTPRGFGNEGVFESIQSRQTAIDDTGKQIGNGKTFFSSNYVTDKIFLGAGRRMKPNRKLVNDYKLFLASSLEKVMKSQLNVSKRFYFLGRQTFKGVGYGTGALQSSIKIKGDVYIENIPSKGRVFIDYQLEPVDVSGFDYGEYISGGRRAGYIPVQLVINWINQKRAKNVWKLRIKQPKNGKLITKKKATLGMAIAISRKANNMNKPPVVKDWNDVHKNAKMKAEFKRIVRKEGYSYRNKIKVDLISKITNKKK